MEEIRGGDKNILELAQHIQNICMSTCNEHKKIEILYMYSYFKSLKSNVYFTLGAHLNLAQFSTVKVKPNLTKTVKWQIMKK